MQSTFVAKALSPAQVIEVRIDEENRIASVVVPERMLSLAIGREGQNARLAAKLTGWRIDIRSDVSVAEAARAEAEHVTDAEVSADEESEAEPSVEAERAAEAGEEAAAEPSAAAEPPAEAKSSAKAKSPAKTKPRAKAKSSAEAQPAAEPESPAEGSPGEEAPS